LAFKMIFGPLAKEFPWLYDICLEIVNIPDREQRHKRIEEVRRISKYMQHPEFRHPEFRHPEMNELFHGEFWMMLENLLDRIDMREEKYNINIIKKEEI